AARVINDKHTEVLVTGFQDKILVVITQYGKVGSLIHVTLGSLSTTSQTLTPVTNVNFILGSPSSLYQIYASHIASIIKKESPSEGRSVVVGLALKKNVGTEEEEIIDKELFDQIEIMVKECRVW
ncbi:16143_t:CDS:2, partial [Acaulospora morrowiae]